MAQFNAENYIDVQERITRFWTENPEGAIRTNLMSPPDDFTQCRFTAAVYKQAAQTEPDATGWAFELAAPGTKGPNATSHEENCETSAIGRALANMGYATTREDRPSRQEMRKVERVSVSQATRDVAPGRATAPPPTQDGTPAVNAAPEPTAQATPAKERADDYRKTQNAHYHATATDHGLSEAAQKLYALARFPDRTGDHTSRSQLTGQELHDLALQVKDDAPLLDEGAPPPTVDYANRIAAAIDRAELARIAAEMKGAGVAADWLRAMWKRRNDEVPAMVMAAATPIGTAGADKYTG